jgi:hypothetical protein
MKPYKTPNLDGFQCIFFKQYCHIVGDVIFCLVKTTIHTGYFDPAISETLITLIPKINPRTTFKDFRPISLCKFVYKIITKVLVLRLRPILNSIIKPYQGSSLPGRGTSDHAIILLEIIHFMRKSKKKKGFVAFKLELEKAFDNFNWNFLKSCLHDFGFHDATTRLSMHCVTSYNFSLLWKMAKICHISSLPMVSHKETPYLLIYSFSVWKNCQLPLTMRFTKVPGTQSTYMTMGSDCLTSFLQMMSSSSPRPRTPSYALLLTFLTVSVVHRV